MMPAFPRSESMPSMGTLDEPIEWHLTSSARNKPALKFVMVEDTFFSMGSQEEISEKKKILLGLADAFNTHRMAFAKVMEAGSSSCYKYVGHGETCGFYLSKVKIMASMETITHWFWDMKYQRLKFGTFPESYQAIATCSEDEAINYMIIPPSAENSIAKERIVHEKLFRGVGVSICTSLSVESPSVPPFPGFERDCSMAGYVITSINKEESYFIHISECQSNEPSIMKECEHWCRNLNRLKEICETGVLEDMPAGMDCQHSIAPRGPIIRTARERQPPALIAEGLRKACGTWDLTCTDCCFGFLKKSHS